MCTSGRTPSGAAGWAGGYRSAGRRIRRGTAPCTSRRAAGARSLYAFPSGVKDSFEGNVADRESVESSVDEVRSGPEETVEWSRVRYTGYSLLSVEAGGRGAAPRLTVSALAQSGERIDHFEVRRRLGARGRQ